jgi:hypothetical protein
VDDIILMSDQLASNPLSDEFFKRFRVFLVSDGTKLLRGVRIRHAYIDWECYKDPNYEDCLRVIKNNIGLTSRSGAIFLI